MFYLHHVWCFNILCLPTHIGCIIYNSMVVSAHSFKLPFIASCLCPFALSGLVSKIGFYAHSLTGFDFLFFSHAGLNPLGNVGLVFKHTLLPFTWVLLSALTVILSFQRFGFIFDLATFGIYLPTPCAWLSFTTGCNS